MAASRPRSRANRSPSGSIASARRKRLRDVAVGLRGFFLADPDELSLLALADQFAEDGAPGGEKMFRIVGGNDRLPAMLAKALGSRLQLRTILRRVTQTRDGVTAALESNGRVDEARFDYLVCAMPATTLRDVVFEPRLPEPQRQAVDMPSSTAPRRKPRCSSIARRGGSAASRERSARRCRSAPCGTATRSSARHRSRSGGRRDSDAARRRRRERRHARDARRRRPVAHRPRAVVARS